jgi:cellulose synthase/poly-beta-1,6-N-acetylglucosamine synthase-like glycosyltransferase
MPHCLVSVVVVAKNEARNIEACLQSLLGQDFPSGGYEVIVVDGGSMDRTREIVTRYPVVLITDRFGTLGHQRNTGVQHASGCYVAFTDADCVADTSWLKNLVETIQKAGPEVAGVCGPNLVWPQDSDFARVVGYTQETFLGSGGSVQAANPGRFLSRANTLPNCNAVYRRDILVREGYDNRLGVGEDADLNFRLRRRGYRFLYAPRAVVWHRRAPDLGRFAAKMFAYGEAMGKLTRKHRAVVRWYAFLPPSVLLVGLLMLGSYPFYRVSAVPALVLGGIALYAAGVAFSVLQVFRKFPKPVCLWSAMLIPVQHLAYGLGFLSGVMRGTLR